MMTNVPAFAGEVFVFLLLSNFIFLFLLWIAFGGIFTLSVDLTGQPIYISLGRKIIAVVLLLGVMTYFAIELVLCARFLPYWVEGGQTSTEVITAKSIATGPDGAPVAYWVTTQNHRFGVSEDIYKNFWVGEMVTFRYRPSDDSLFAIGPASGPSPALFHSSPSLIPPTAPPVPPSAMANPSPSPSPTKKL